MSDCSYVNGGTPDLLDRSTIEPSDWPQLAKPALYAFVGEIVGAATEQSEADPAAVLITCLTAVGTALGRTPWIKIADDFHHPRLFSVIVGQSARGRKGTSEGPIRRIFDAAASAVGPMAWKPGPMSSGEGLINAIRDATGDDDPGVVDKRLLIVESEFGAPLRAMRREGNTLSTTLRTAWDGKDLEPITKSKPIKASRPHVGVVGHITKAELDVQLGQVEIFNGFANRFLWCCARRQRLVPLARGLSDEAVERLGNMLTAQLTASMEIERIDFSPDAGRLYVDAYERLTAEHDGLYGVVTSRAEVQVIRIAMIYACLDGSSTIDLQHLYAAFAVWNYCDSSAKLLFGGTAIDPLEDRVMRALLAGPKSTTELHEHLGNHATSAALSTALARLEKQGRIESAMQPTGGRPRIVWRLRDEPGGAK
jgi:hypothetical protein